jgi:hypothetical protein
VRSHTFPKAPRFPRRRVAALAAGWRAVAEAYNANHPRVLTLGHCDCQSYADGLARALTAELAMPDAAAGTPTASGLGRATAAPDGPLPDILDW